MEKIYKYFSFTVLALLAILTVCVFILPTITELSAQKTYSEELTGFIIDSDIGGNENIDMEAPYHASGVNNHNYAGLKSWGILRGKNGELPKADPGAPELISKYNSIYIADTSQKIIYLTFDEGYENGYTAKILDILYENKVSAIFFITGPYLEQQEKLIQRMLDEGHAVGNHTINHKSLPLLNEKQLEEEVVGLDRRFQEKFGQNMVFLRAPKGEYSEKTLEITSNMGYVNVFWSFAYDDWAVNKQRGWEYAFEKVKQNIHNGEIILLHAVSKDNCEALNAIIEYVRSNGYEFGDVFDLENMAKGEG